MTSVRINVNGHVLERDITPRMHLGDFVREEGRFTGTHLGCEHGVCGACTVLLDGQPVRSCTTFAVACEGRQVTTVEGFEQDPVMALLREAFSEHHALQCGYCTPGMLTTARDILLRLPEANEHQIRVELSGNLCRCTGYMGIVEAIRSVLKQLREQPDAAIGSARAQALKGHGVAIPTSGGTFVSFTTEHNVQTSDVERSASPALESSSERVPAGVKGGTRMDGRFNVAYPPEQVWAFMADLEAVAGCLPGANLEENDGERVKGFIAIKFGPMAAKFAGAARLTRNEEQRLGMLKGGGQDTISQSRASGEICYRVLPGKAGATLVEVEMLYSLQGPLAQFSRSGLVKDFVARMILDFGRNVELRMDPHAKPLTEPPKLNVFALGMSIIWNRIKGWFG
ncbi:carbon monoxide dehydrogenase, small subunit [Pseudomonas synxantha BG33R]|uniref:xanthine dehydrogenase family Fe-S subunit n=1 Tax=Pseudomonas synxantha TaxID=47883 RepID=UPI00025FEB46|nr:2Fe-2S iron-sulfur cluster-binding protein [Pseudomonas synxantha]EIK69240.1 carbon monoxide dehydrogenase, small subunit [Pseudomonas synxantha BG33R]